MAQEACQGGGQDGEMGQSCRHQGEVEAWIQARTEDVAPAPGCQELQ